MGKAPLRPPKASRPAPAAAPASGSTKSAQRTPEPAKARGPDLRRAALLGHNVTGLGASGAPGPVLQRYSVPEAAGLGTAGTTAPIATVSPQRQMNEELDRQLIAIARARILLPWIDLHMRFGLDEVMADTGLVKRMDLSKDKELLARIYPFPGSTPPYHTGQLFTEGSTLKALLAAPKDQDEIREVLDLLQQHGAVVRSSTGRFLGSGWPFDIDRGYFDRQAAQIEQSAVDFKKRVELRDPLRPILATQVIPYKWGSGDRRERGADESTGAKRQELEDQLKPLAADDPRRAALGMELAAASRAATVAQKYRTFAASTVVLIERLKKINSNFSAFNYTHHFWGELSADIHLKATVEKGGFWTQDAVRQFFEDLNAACEDSSPPGKFAWKAIYNDQGIRAEMNQLYGAGRVLWAPHHGPDPDKLHIHLDLRPLTVTRDQLAG